jgi:hypothetical protein
MNTMKGGAGDDIIASMTKKIIISAFVFVLFAMIGFWLFIRWKSANEISFDEKDAHPNSSQPRTNTKGLLKAESDDDQDGLSYELELKYGFDPNKADWNDANLDTDGDKVSDRNEWILGTNKEKKDTDGDGISDFYEVISGLDPLRLDFVDAFEDNDNDGLSNEDEKKYGTGIFDPDTDGDSYKDGEEVKNGYNPMGKGKMTQ